MINRMYQLYELRDELPQAIENCQKLADTEDEFITMVKESGKYEKFEFMLKDFEEEKQKLHNQIDNLKFRLPLVEELIANYEKQDETSKVIADTVTKVFEAIGAVSQSTNESADDVVDVPVEETVA